MATQTVKYDKTKEEAEIESYVKAGWKVLEIQHYLDGDFLVLASGGDVPSRPVLAATLSDLERRLKILESKL